MTLRVDVATGGTVLDAVDLYLPGLFPVVFARRYESVRKDRSALGPGWRSGWDVQLIEDEDGVRLQGGRMDGIRFAPLAPGKEARQDSSGFVLQHHRDGYVLALSPRRQLVFGRSGTSQGALGLSEVRDAAGNSLRMSRRGGRLDRVADADGRALNLSYDGDLLVALALEAGGRSARIRQFQYSARGEMTSVTDAQGFTWRYRYDAGFMVEAVSPAGGRHYASYDEFGRCLAVWDDAGRAYHVRHDDLRQLRRVVDPTGGQTLYQHVLSRQVLERIGHCGESQAYYYDEIERLIGHSVRGGRVATFHRHDGKKGRISHLESQERAAFADLADSNRTIAFSDAYERLYELTLDERALLTGITTPEGAGWRFDRDKAGRVTAIHCPLGRKVGVQWGRKERIVTDGKAVVRRETFDDLGRLVASTDAIGRRRSYRYDIASRLTHVAVNDAFGIEFIYDEFGLLAGSVDTERNRVAIRRDAHGRTTELNLGGRKLAVKRDGLGRVSGVTEGTGSALSISYDEREQAQQIASGSTALAIEYEEHRTTLRTPEISRSYAVTGELVESGSSADGTRTEYVYGACGEILVWQQVADEATVAMKAFTYDGEGRLVELLSFAEENNVPVTTRLQWESDGALASVELAGRAIRIERDASRRITRLATDTLEIAITLDAAGRLESASGEGLGVRLESDVLDRPSRWTETGAQDRTVDLRKPGETVLASWDAEDDVTVGLHASHRGAVLFVEWDHLRIPIWHQRDFRSGPMDASLAAVIGLADGIEAVPGSPVLVGEGALARWRDASRWNPDPLAVPTSLAVGQAWPLLDCFFLDESFLDAHPDRVAGLLPARHTAPARELLESVAGPHIAGTFPSKLWSDRCAGPHRRREDLVPGFGTVDEPDVIEFLVGQA
jgi:YD repeat-containing protein